MCSNKELLTVFSSETTLDIERQTGWDSNGATLFTRKQTTESIAFLMENLQEGPGDLFAVVLHHF